MNNLDLYKLAPLNSYVPTLDTIKLITADGELNKELKDFMLNEHQHDLLKDKKIAILATDGVEEIEILVPLNYLRQVGAKVSVVSPKKEEFPDSLGVKFPENRNTHIMTVRLMENSGWLKIDQFLDEVSENDFDGLVIPGGAWSPDFLRTNPDAQHLVQSLFITNKPLAVMCHGPLILIDSNLVKGKKMTGYWSIMKDLENAGADVRDEPVVIDDNLITSRFPYDIPRFMAAFTKQLMKNS
ncbi:TPA: type 1 glutamine amidotransferase domain-containing protein [Photobacterium damselae]